MDIQCQCQLTNQTKLSCFVPTKHMSADFGFSVELPNLSHGKTLFSASFIANTEGYYPSESFDLLRFVSNGGSGRLHAEADGI